ncbi:MAG: endonuclease III domain-containing protein [Planctomycetota bacterium]|jgi:endonuclease-3 related protein
MLSDKLRRIYALLFERFGSQGWWPGDSEFEIIIGAILTQNTNWGNVEKAIGNLKAAEVLSVEGLCGLELSRLAELIRPAGYYNIKAKRLRNFLDWLVNKYGGELANLENVGTAALREELLSIKGIGPETADSVLLYALGRSVFVVDAYTARVAVRHGLIESGADYEQLQYLFESNLPEDLQMFNEYHALLVRVGKEYCRPKVNCRGCPLEVLEHESETDGF